MQPSWPGLNLHSCSPQRGHRKQRRVSDPPLEYIKALLNELQFTHFIKGAFTTLAVVAREPASSLAGAGVVGTPTTETGVRSCPDVEEAMATQRRRLA